MGPGPSWGKVMNAAALLFICIVARPRLESPWQTPAVGPGHAALQLPRVWRGGRRLATHSPNEDAVVPAKLGWVLPGSGGLPGCVVFPNRAPPGTLVNGRHSKQLDNLESCWWACAETPPCNAFVYCPAEGGCSYSENLTVVPLGSCELRHQALSDPVTGRPVVAIDAPGFIGGAPIPGGINAQPVSGYTMILAQSFYNRYNYQCEGSSIEGLCLLRGTPQELAPRCDADPQCGIMLYFPFGMDYMGPRLTMFKGGYGVELDVNNTNLNPNTVAYLKQGYHVANSPPPPSLSSSGSLSGGAVAGIVVGACAGLAVGAAGVALFVRRRRRQGGPAKAPTVQELPAKSSSDLSPESSAALRAFSLHHSLFASPQGGLAAGAAAAPPPEPSEQELCAWPDAGTATATAAGAAGPCDPSGLCGCCGPEGGAPGEPQSGPERHRHQHERLASHACSCVGASPQQTSCGYSSLKGGQDYPLTRRESQQQDLQAMQQLSVTLSSTGTGPGGCAGGSLGAVAHGNLGAPQLGEGEAKEVEGRTVPGEEGGEAGGSLGSPQSSSTLLQRLPDDRWQDCVVPFETIHFCKNADGTFVQLGTGAFGTIYKVLLHGIQPLAAKIVDLGSDADLQNSFLQEAAVLRRLRHRNIVGFAGVCASEGRGIILMELMEGKDLYSLLCIRSKQSTERAFSWYNRGKRVALDVALGIHYLHSLNLTHFDIKSSNVLMTRDMTAKLGDVGFTRLMSNTHHSMGDEKNGTFAYMAPELLVGQTCREKVDIYSFGVLLWEIASGEHPLRGRNRPLHVPEDCPQGVVDLVVDCTAQDPDARPTAKDLVERLSKLAC